MKQCLLVIDVQASFTARPYFDADLAHAYLQQQNRLISACLAAGLPVVRVLHVEPDEPAGNPFALKSGLVRPMDGLIDFAPTLTIHKTRHSALVGTELAVWLVQQQIGELIISGIRTEQCCETTARHASDLGWQVCFVPDATLSFAMQLPDGRPFPPEEIRARTVAVLADRFARIASVDTVLTELST